jgi:hypothetical protein
VGIFRTVPLAGFFPAGECRESYHLLPGVFRKTPQGYFIRVSLVVHDYLSQDMGIKLEWAAGESVGFVLFFHHRNALEK